MIGPDDIETFKDDIEVFERVKARVQKGVPPEREISADERLPFLRAAFQWQSVALKLWAEIQERDARTRDNMGISD